MSDALYLDDSYLKEFDATVVSANSKFVVLDKTAFYPNSGGQLFDEGEIRRGGETFKVVFVGKFSGSISHEVDREGLKLGDKVHCVLDWDKRYQLMRMHTSAHIVSTLVHNEAGALITGNQLGVDKSRVDFSLDDFDRDKMVEYIDKANEVIRRNLEVKSFYLPREEAMRIPSVVKLAGALPPAIDTLRIVQIGDFDTQADGGTHVRNTSEVGELEFLQVENKGKNNRRLYYKLKK
ncbi:MAG: alanyl-tRNA editing protein [Nanoarchaeota archaeon]|nr:alanyl-tRNA editing protein [Nanoarchaeota archaeon]MBU1269234.1 alanyl-tRNA editing protein [Nanoarchaeota archaeon]MBU1604920.1 alanyl-tRNA editing protein [Nanoarchaeota archaeon]MBU2443512.1 alanyl-tRNA editing protein [Nanoarchaeota archaeon]